MVKTMLRAYNYPTFEAMVDIFLRQDERKIAALVRHSHDYLLLSGASEKNAEHLAQGIYRLRYYLAEGQAIHQWLALLNRTQFKTNSPLTDLQREITFGWLLAQNNQPELAAIAYHTAANMHKSLSRDPFGQVAKPQMQQTALDIMVGQCFLRADRNPDKKDVEEALYYWQRIWRQGAQDQEKRLILALAALKVNAGMVVSSFANADEAHHFFDGRGMNAEAGLAAFYMARYYAEEEGIDAVHEAATGNTLRWIRRASAHWHGINLPIGERLIAPYIRHLNLVLPPRRVSRKDRHLMPPTYILN